MAKTLEELQASGATILADMTALNDKEMDAVEVSKFDELQAKYDKNTRDIKLLKVNAELEATTDEVIAPNTAVASDLATATAEYRDGFDNVLSSKTVALSGDVVATMTVGVDADGGYIVPESYQKFVTMKLNSLGRTRSIANVLSTESTKNIPTEGAAPTFAWIDEGGVYGQTDSKFGNTQIEAWKLGGIIKVSEELLQDNMINFESYMAGQIALGIDKAESPTFATGDGVKKATGYTVTGIVGANSTTAALAAVTSDELFGMYFDLKEEYRANATWRMNDSTLKAISMLKDGQGNYIFPTLRDGSKPTLFGRPIVIDNGLPDMATGAKFIAVGDFSYYQIGDRGSMTIQRLDELYAATGYVGFKVTKRVDGKVIVVEAFNIGQNA